MNSWVDLSALWRILLIGVIAGAGLPALFAVGLRALGSGGAGTATTTDSERIVGGSPVGIAVASVCFAVVLAAIGWGIYFIVNGS